MSRASKKKREDLIRLRRDFKKGKRIERLAYYTSLERGRNTERLAERALEKLLEDGKIKSFSHSKPYSIQDKKGIDFIVMTYMTYDGEKIFLQIKSSIGGAKKFIERVGEEIKVVIIEPGENLENIQKKIEKVIFQEKCD